MFRRRNLCLKLQFLEFRENGSELLKWIYWAFLKRRSFYCQTMLAVLEYLDLNGNMAWQVPHVEHWNKYSEIYSEIHQQFLTDHIMYILAFDHYDFYLWAKQ